MSRPFTPDSIQRGGVAGAEDGRAAAALAGAKDLEKIRAEAMGLLLEAGVLAEEAVEMAAADEALRAALLNPGSGVRAYQGSAFVPPARADSPPRSRLSTAFSCPERPNTSLSSYGDGLGAATAEGARLGVRAAARVAQVLMSLEASTWIAALRILSGGLWRPMLPDEKKKEMEGEKTQGSISPYMKKEQQRTQARTLQGPLSGVTCSGVVV